MWNLKYDTNVLVYKTETDSDIKTKLMLMKGERRGDKLEFGINRHTLLHMQ